MLLCVCQNVNGAESNAKIQAVVGKMLTKNLVGSVEIGFPLIEDYHVYDFKMEWRLGFFF